MYISEKWVLGIGHCHIGALAILLFDSPIQSYQYASFLL